MSAHLRQHPRFIDQRRVEVEISDRAELQQLWTGDISKGGMFLESETPPPLGTQLQINLATPDGSILLHGRVVHVVDVAAAKAFGQAPGVGVAFMDLSREVRERIERYVDGLAQVLTTDLKTDPESEPLEILLEEAKRITAALNDSDLYRAIDLPPDAASEQITGAISELCHRFAHPPSDCPPPKAARLVQLSRQIEKAGALFANPLRRLHYDFHHGHVRAEERAAAGQDLEHLRTVWRGVFPERVDKARELTKRALTLEHAGKLDECKTVALEALDNDPFNAELRRAIDAWEKGERNAVAAPPEPEDEVDAGQAMTELLEIHRRLAELDYFEVLGVEEDASAQDIARAFMIRSHRYDPETLRGRVPQSVLGIAAEYQRVLDLAYRTLSDGTRRRQYLASKAPASSALATDKKEVARVKNEMGIVFLRKGDFVQAREMFQAAMALAPEIADFGANFAWSMIMDPKLDRTEVAARARPLLVAAIDKTPGSTPDEKKRRARYHYYLGRLFREQNQVKAAVEQLESAIELNPRLSEAATELRLIAMRTRKK